MPEQTRVAFAKFTARIGPQVFGRTGHLQFERDAVALVLVGGYAVAFHGRPRATKDIDLVLEASVENLARAARLSRGLAPRPT